VSWLSRLTHDLRSLFHRGRLERDLDEELRSHLDLLADRKEREGIDPDGARRAARVEFGSVDGVKEAVRDARFARVVEDFGKDLAHGGRMLAKAPGYAVVAVLTLALGIGATTAIFSVVHAVLIRPLPYDDPGRLALVWSNFSGMGARRAPASPFELREIGARSQALAGLAGIWVGNGTLTGDGEPEQLKVGFCTWNFFDVLGARPLLGRTFLREDARRTESGTILLSHGVWQRRFGADPAVVGKAVRFEGGSVTVVGVMPAGFRLVFPPDSSVPEDIQAWVAFPDEIYGEPRTDYYLRVLARMGTGVTIDEAQREATAIAGQLRGEFGEFGQDGLELEVLPLHQDAVRSARPTLLALFAGVGLVLLIACVNVANLLLARASYRRKEIAIRTALGATRGRVTRQLAAESLLLAGLGGVLGLAVGRWGLSLLLGLRPSGLVLAEAVPLDLHVLGFALGVSLLTGLLFGLAPGVFSSRVDPGSALQESSRGSTAAGRQRFRSALVVSEVALGFVLLIGAGLMVRTLSALQKVNPGFRAAGVLTFEVNLPRARYPTDVERRRFARAFGEKLAQLPVVEAQGAISHLPLDDFPNWYSPYAPVGVPEQQSRGLLADHRTATAGYLHAMGAELLEGRMFDERDDEGQRNIAIVDDLLAQKHWPGESAVGKRIRHEFYDNGRFLPREAEVVGVIRHIRHHGLQIQLREQVYVPYPQSARPRLSFAVRTSQDPLSILPSVGRALHELDKDLALSKARPMEWYLHRATTASRFTTILASLFGGLALVLALVGIFGVVSYSVGQRKPEIAVRMALGARPTDVLAMVVREGVGLTLAGLLVGLGGALYLTRYVDSLLYGVSHLDPATYAAVLLLLPLCAAVASGIPANRAARVNPVTSLQAQ
jgi:predicted permease